jgi:hypothetical protein
MAGDKEGLALELTAKGTKYFKDEDLNRSASFSSTISSVLIESD